MCPAVPSPHPEPHAQGFTIVHGNRLEELRDVCVHYLQRHPLAPLQPEIVLVQSAAMGHWLEHALAQEHALGICAATRFELPGSYLWQVYRLVLGATDVARVSPLDKAPLLWRLMRMLPDLAVHAVYAPLRAYLGPARDARRCYALALQIADVLDAYQSYRADWLQAWAHGQDVLIDRHGGRQPLAQEQRWQAALWRDLMTDIGPAAAAGARPSVHQRCMRTLSDFGTRGQAPPGLPSRLVVFAVASLPAQMMELLVQLGRFLAVLVLVHNPSPHNWAGEADPGSTHPLLQSWGKNGSDYLRLLDAVDACQGGSVRVDVFCDPLAPEEAPTQLAQLQSGLFHLQPPTQTPLVRAPEDDSLVWVSAYSAQREVEILHDQLLAWLDANPQLQPHDIAILVADLDGFAPHIHAVFGRFSPNQDRHIPYTVATAPLAMETGMRMALQWLLQLPTARITLAQWQDLFAVPPVRARFAVQDAEVQQLTDWLLAAQARWGLDATHRRDCGWPADLNDLDQNTWAFALRRLLLGYAVGPGAPWQGIAPQEGLQGLDADLYAKLEDWLEACAHARATLSQEQTPTQWCASLSALLARFFAPADEASAQVLQRWRDALEDWLSQCVLGAFDAPVALSVVREHWLSRIDAAVTERRFAGAGVQFSRFMPLRSQPFAVVAMLGMNDSDYPRSQPTQDFDLMAHSWRPGDRARREDDRYLFLQALLSARRHVYISWQGQRATDNTPRPPSVLVAQLLEFVQQGWTPGPTVQQHPLHAYARSYFTHNSGLRTYAREWARVHAPAPSVEAAQIAPPVPSVLTVADLGMLLRQPVEVYFRRRLRVRLDEPAQSADANEPFALSGLQRYTLGDAVLRAAEAQTGWQALQLSGQLPLAALGKHCLQRLHQNLQVPLDRRDHWQHDYARALEPLPLTLTLGAVQLDGAITGLYGRRAQGVAGDGALLQLIVRPGQVVERVRKVDIPRGHALGHLWVQHLALCAVGRSVRSVLVGTDAEIHLDPLASDIAHAYLEQLVLVYANAWQRPLPLACKTAWAYHWDARAGDLDLDPHRRAALVFEAESAHAPILKRCFPEYEALRDLLPTWAERLYGPVALWAKVHAHA